ncbi:MAG: hypothetical protein JXJ20_02165 [Anaerolineae bacterium]|jgi:hypothetical protein|nr:hypothetical protein [Anaerolineae bacterium]
MTPELIVLLVGSLGLGGLGARWATGRRARQRYVLHTRTEWARAGRTVHYGPVGATCFGSRPRRTYRQGIFGALGLVDGRVVFDGYQQGIYDASIPLDNIHWIRVHNIPVMHGRTAAPRRGLVLHAEDADGWHVHSFLLEAPDEFARQISHHSPSRTRQDTSYHAERDDFGPARAVRMRQDIYGQWEPDRQGSLYLAPDRLLFDWHHSILLAHIQRLDVFSKGGLHDLLPYATDLLRIETGPPDGEPLVVGFLVRQAQQWAEAIAQKAQAPLVIHQGRKKKEV